MSLDTTLASVRALGAAFLDPWVIMDRDNRVVDFDAGFRGLFPRHHARRLKGSACCQFMSLSVCADGEHLATRCLEAAGTVRYDEIEAIVEGEARPRRLIASATPLGDAALVLLRDVSDLADMQRKYRDLLERETREKDALRKEIARKTKELMDTNMELNRVQQDLMRFKKGLFG